MHNRTEVAEPSDAGSDAAAKAARERVWKRPPRWLPPTFHALAYRDYLLLWLGQITRSLAIWMDLVGRPALVLIMTGSPVQLGAIALVRGIPMLIFGPIAGMWSDRIDRRQLMLASMGVNLAIHVAFVYVVATGQVELWHVYVSAILKSLTQAFDNPARSALLPSLVPPRLLMNAIALNTGSMQLVRIVSASIAGFAIAGWAYFFAYGADDTRSFAGVYIMVVLWLLLAFIATYLLKVPEEGRVHRADETWLASLMAGFRYAWNNPVILGILVLLCVQHLFGLPYLQVFVPWLAIEVMEIGPEGMGLLIGLSGVGSLVGSLVLATWSERVRRRGGWIVAGVVVYGLALAGMGLGSILPVTTVMGLALPVVPAVMIIVVGLGQTVMITMKNTLLLEETPDALRGRIMSLQSLDRAFSTVGSGVAGFAIAWIGGPLGLAVYGFLCAVGALGVGACFPKLRRVD